MPRRKTPPSSATASADEGTGTQSPHTTAPTTQALVVAAPAHSRRRKGKSRAKTGAARKLVWTKRDRQDSQIYNLKLDNNDLKLEIHKLQTARDMLAARQLNRYDDNDGLCMKVVVEYFKVFQHGLTASPVDAVGFLGNIMADDVAVNNFAGLDMVVEQWKTHSACFSELDFRVVDAFVVPLSDRIASVRCAARFCATITLDTIALMFPHVLHYEPIVSQLVGRQLKGDGQYEFDFDAKTQQVVRCGVVMDLFSVFARLLPNARDLAMLFNQALVVDEFYIGEHDDDVDISCRSQQKSPADGEFVDQDSSQVPVVGPCVRATKMSMDHILSDLDGG